MSNERIPWAEVITSFQKRGRDAPQSDAVYSSIDPILDKISKFEIGSLTPERAAATNRETPATAKEIRVTLWVSRVGYFLLLQLQATSLALQTVFR
jgi:hypothetical protein